ncbi:MAG: UDP-N-acetylmuramate--alanine ligase [Chthoniobacter sp.]|jgi:UDP-N-acetylmuramate--L-alanine ligase/UDP-N-acetylenolpyruvoylglucosamine reductase|nr:UDP-N-acetylmuramate--alanine ligase [Chthoniobacter sp.]
MENESLVLNFSPSGMLSAGAPDAPLFTSMDTGQILADILFAGEMRVHLIGVAGSGMSGIAGLLLALGHPVSGSDKVSTVEIERLQKLGLRFSTPHTAEAIADADLVIFSSAIKPGNVAYDEAQRLGKMMVRRADALAAVMNRKKGIVVCGMHGKTTTSSMAAHVLRVGGLNPSHYVGAEIPILGTNANWDAEGEFFVAEGDESDGTLALYHPEHAIVLNVEEEHLDYYENLAAIEAVYRQLIAQTSGKIFYSADDEIAARLCSSALQGISFGENVNAAYRFQAVLSRAFRSQFKVFRHGKWLGDFTLNVPGKHNISNATAVIALATELGVEVEKIAEAFESFRGAKRRFEVKYRSDQFMVVDDYGHHPSEIRATLATARAVGSKRAFVMFQPHRYSRTQALAEEFGDAFADADRVFVTDVYAASEKPIPGVSGRTVVDSIAKTGHTGARYVPDRRAILPILGPLLQPGDMVLSLGAGDIHEQGTRLAQDLARIEELQSVMGTGAARLYEPIAKHTTLRVGGPAQFWLEPETEAGFARLVKHCVTHQIPLFVLGRGSNLLVRDGGIQGVVAHLARGDFKKLEVAGNRITAGVGVKLKEVAYAARDANLAGFEWMEGIPGNVGGGLRMNAGAMGGETFDNVISVRVVNQDGEFQTKLRSEMEVQYRHVPTLVSNYAVAAIFEGRPGNHEEIERLLADSMHKRRTTQPKESSAGCIFKNPGVCGAGKLIDELGLKNTSIGAARVSEVHGNFIVNDGDATAAEVLELIEKVKAAAREQRGIELETEVQIIGEELSK